MKRPTHHVIYTHGGGRLGNQVIRFAHWIAWAHEYSGAVQVVNIAFWPFAQFFELWREHPGCAYPVRDGNADRVAARRAALPPSLRDWLERRCRLQRLVQTAGHWWPGCQAVELDVVREESLELDNDFLFRVTRRPTTMCSGWKIANWSLIAKHESHLRDLFRPARNFAERAEKFVRQIRAQHDVLIGVLIRQSDYREWYDGRFFFPATQYAIWMRQLLELYRGRCVAFVVASETWHHPGIFANLPVYFASGSPNAGGHWFESWVEMSRCDMIVSPPSTFSATAAFLGRVALWPVVARDQPMAFDQVMADGIVEAARHPVFSLSVK